MFSQFQANEMLPIPENIVDIDITAHHWLCHNDSMLCCRENRWRLSRFAPTLAMNKLTCKVFVFKNTVHVHSM